MAETLAFHSVPLSSGHQSRSVGTDRLHQTARPSHDLLADGRVRITVPGDGIVSDNDARRLAWAILADLAPDEVLPTPEIVTYKEAQRLALLRAVGAGAVTTAALANALNWNVCTVQRRARELVNDGRLLENHPRFERRFSLAVGGEPS